MQYPVRGIFPKTRTMQQTKTWITGHDLKKVTGWDRYTMSKARRLNWIKYMVTDKKSYVYLLESIPQSLIKQTA
jgi:hypothetical protein